MKQAHLMQFKSKRKSLIQNEKTAVRRRGLTGDLVDLLHHIVIVLWTIFWSSSPENKNKPNGQIEMSCKETYKVTIKKRMLVKYPLRLWLYLWTREGGANTPYLGRQLKYRTPNTEPSCFPVGWSNSIPNQYPTGTRTRQFRPVQDMEGFRSIPTNLWVLDCGETTQRKPTHANVSRKLHKKGQLS